MEEVHVMMREEQSRVGRSYALSGCREPGLEVAADAPLYRKGGALEKARLEVRRHCLHQIVAAALERRDLEHSWFDEVFNPSKGCKGDLLVELKEEAGVTFCWMVQFHSSRMVFVKKCRPLV